MTTGAARSNSRSYADDQSCDDRGRHRRRESDAAPVLQAERRDQKRAQRRIRKRVQRVQHFLQTPQAAQANRGGDGIVSGLGHVDVVVGVDPAVDAELSPHQLVGAVGEHLVSVHVVRRAGAGLEGIDAELVAEGRKFGHQGLLRLGRLPATSGFLAFHEPVQTEVDGESYEHLEGVFGLRMRTARMRLGDEYIELTEFIAPRGRPAPSDARSNDRWFQHIAIIVSDMDRAYQWLREHKVQHASSGPQLLPAWNKNAGGIRAFYFRDPDGHPLEVLWFPREKGNPKWHVATDRLFLGIDHTAIVISETEGSLKFYRDRLGMEVAGESENYGPEQERLNNVFGARLRITALRAASGPGIEFLEYLAPGDGRPFPPEEKANDLIHWQTRFLGISVDEAAQTLRNSRSAFVSTGAVELPDGKAGFRKAVTVRDPDGHAIQIVER